MFRILVLGLVALPASSCGILESDPAVRVFVAISRPAFLPGDSTTISIIATNQTDRVITISGTCDLFGYEVRDSTGHAVVPRRFCGRQGLVVYELQPGEALSKHLIWWGDREDAETRTRARLPAGTYRVVGDVRSPEATARSAPVALTLIPAR